MLAQYASVGLCWGVRLVSMIYRSYRRLAAMAPEEGRQLGRLEDGDCTRNLARAAIRSETKRDAVVAASNPGLVAVRAL